MKYIHIQKNKGFTLIETMIAVFILTAALSGFFSLLANSLFSARYARNEITANYLLQEAVDHIRNDRDTIAFQQAETGGGWTAFLNKYGYGNGSGSNKCFDKFTSKNGCYFEPMNQTLQVTTCTSTPTFGTIECPVFNYDSEASAHNDFYTYDTAFPPSKFKRQVLMAFSKGMRDDELDVKVTVEWQNGGLTRSKSLVISLLNWQK